MPEAPRARRRFGWEDALDQLALLADEFDVLALRSARLPTPLLSERPPTGEVSILEIIASLHTADAGPRRAALGLPPAAAPAPEPASPAEALAAAAAARRALVAGLREAPPAPERLPLLVGIAAEDAARLREVARRLYDSGALGARG